MSVCLVSNEAQIHLLSHLSRLVSNKDYENLGNKHNSFAISLSVLYMLDSNGDILVVKLDSPLHPFMILGISDVISGINSLLVSPDNRFLLVYSHKKIVFLDLFKLEITNENCLVSYLDSVDANLHRCIEKLGVENMVTEIMVPGINFLKIHKAAFYPVSGSHLMVLTSENLVRMYNLSECTSESIAEQIFDLKKYSHKSDFVSFCFLDSKYTCWAELSLYLLNSDGKIFVMSPIIVDDMNLNQKHLRILRDQLESESDETSSSFEWIKELQPRQTTNSCKTNNLMFAKNNKLQLKVVDTLADSVTMPSDTATNITSFEYQSLQMFFITFERGRVAIVIVDQLVLPAEKLKNQQTSSYNWVLWEVLDFDSNDFSFDLMENRHFGSHIGSAETSSGNEKDVSINNCLYAYSQRGLWRIHLPWVFELDEFNTDTSIECPDWKSSSVELIYKANLFSVLPIEREDVMIGFLIMECVSNRIESKYFPIDNNVISKGKVFLSDFPAEPQEEAAATPGFEQATSLPISKIPVPNITKIEGSLENLIKNHKDLASLLNLLTIYYEEAKKLLTSFVNLKNYYEYANDVTGHLKDSEDQRERKVQLAQSKFENLQARLNSIIETQIDQDARIEKSIDTLSKLKMSYGVKNGKQLIQDVQTRLDTILKQFDTLVQYKDTSDSCESKGPISPVILKLVQWWNDNSSMTQLVEFVKSLMLKVSELHELLFESNRYSANAAY